MKKKHSFLSHFVMFALLILAISGCDNDEVFKLKKEKATLASQGGVVSVKGNNYFWLAEVMEIVNGVEHRPILDGDGESLQGDWYSIKISDRVMDIEVESNETGEERVLRIFAQSLNTFRLFNVIQDK